MSGIPSQDLYHLETASYVDLLRYSGLRGTPSRLEMIQKICLLNRNGSGDDETKAYWEHSYHYVSHPGYKPPLGPGNIVKSCTMVNPGSTRT